jgi:glycerate kinase
MAQALGFRLLDVNDQPIARGGGALQHLERIDRRLKDPRLDDVLIDVACDVTNPLTGPLGAAAVYGPQKGATAEMVEILDANLRRFAAIVRRDLGVEIETAPGAGAAGGLGGGLMAFTRATLRRGVELVIEVVKLRERLQGADLCLTGEGAIDRSSAFGKTAVGVAAVAREFGVPVVALAGAVIQPDARELLDRGVSAFMPIAPKPCTLEWAMAHAHRLLADAAEQAVRIFLAGRGRVG